MLPTNPQSLTAADRSVLENLKQQGEQIDRQSKVLETLVDRVTRQMRSNEKLEKIDQKEKNQIKGDTKVSDIPGMAFDKISDKFNDFIVNRFSSIKDKFNEEKSKPIDKSREPSLKDKKPKDENGVLKDILSNMVTTSKYQEQMLEHTKALQSIADKTFVSINNLTDNLKNIEQPENNITEKTNEIIPEKKENNKVKTNKEKQTPALFLPKEKLETDNEISFSGNKVPDQIGVSVGKSLKPQFDILGKIFKDSLREGFDLLNNSISNLDSPGLPPIIPTPLSTVAKNAAAGGAAGAAASRAAGIAKRVLKAGGALSLATYSSDAGHTQEEEDALLEEARQKEFVPESPDKKIGLREETPSQAQVRAIDNKIDEIAKKEQPKKLGFGPGMKAPITAEDYKKIALDNKIDKPNITAKPEKLGFGPGMKAPITAEDYKKIAAQKLQSSSLMKEVTDQRAELVSENKSSAPIIVNNTTNAVSESDSSANFSSATPRNQSTAVNDYFRNNGRLHDSVYG